MASETNLQVVESPGAYIYFVVAAFLLTLVLGPILGTLLWMSRSGMAMQGREEALVQAHGWAQLLGWPGLFVAGFSLRLVPRFARRPGASNRYAMTILAGLVAGLLLRVAGLIGGGGWSGLAVGGGAVLTASMAGLALSLAITLRQNRHEGTAWAPFVWLGAGWWAISGLLQLGLSVAALHRGTAPAALDRVTVWVFTLGAIGNLIWAVQARMMPSSFGRSAISRRAVLVPALLYNCAAVVILLSALAGYNPALATRAMDGFIAALGLAGASIIWLAALCGSMGGRAERLRPASNHLGWFIVWANRWALIAGVLLLLLGVHEVLPPPLARMGLEDGALHAFTVGLITILIAGMLQLVAPVFAMERMGTSSPRSIAFLVLLLLMTAAIGRVVAALSPPLVAGSFNPLAELSALSGWFGLALLAGALVRARIRGRLVGASRFSG